jgi:Ca2+-binding RTX toxin-like protein
MGFVVFAGQSNMGGWAQDASTLPASWRPDPLTFIWNAQSHAWEQMQPGVNTGYGAFTQTWGPEVQFAVDFRAEHPGEPLHIVKVLAGGTQLALDATPGVGDWSPSSQGELFDDVTQIVHEARVALDYLRPTAVFWGQGEEDAVHPDAAAAYGQNLAQLFAAMRSEWLQDPQGKIGFFRIGTTPPYADEVRAGELATDQADANADSFDAAGFPKQSDSLHYTNVGLDTVGDGFYQLYRSWPPGDEGPGLAGNDTLTVSVSGGAIHGGPGADVFTFTDEPWAPVHITDFVLGQDRIDLGPLLQKAGYAGADPVADRYVILQSDGAGGTEVLFDRDGPGGAQFFNYVADIEHASPEAATWTVLTGGAATGPITGGPGADTLQGSSGHDVLLGAGGDDEIFGGAGDDLANGNTGQDTLHGGDGDDTLSGGQGGDVVYGDGGSDEVLGNLGADTLDGGDGADVIRGGQAADVLSGGAGDDWLSGDRGDDTLSGGAGADRFHSFSEAGLDRVLDFNAAEGDRVLLDAGATYTASQQGGDVVIQMGGGEMLLVGVQLTSLPPGWLVAG